MRSRLAWFRSNVLPPLIGSLIAIGLVFGAGTLYFRLTTPFADKTWPIREVDGVGWLFQPNAEVRRTNDLDFWVEESANSLGFLDREPPAQVPPSACRVAFIGDSFVEAAQVRNEQKVQAVLEALARERGLPQVAARGYGYSGTGQLNQLPFYDRYARAFAPDVVVLVVVVNDFTNNSSLLEAVRNGFHPDHAPRVFAKLDTQTGLIALQPTDPRWKDYLIPLGDAAPEAACWTCRQHQRLVANNAFYRWIATKARLLYPSLLAALEPRPARSPAEARVDWLARQDTFASAFGNWRGDTDIDQVFFEQDLPPAFAQAMRYTQFAFETFKQRVEADGARLVVLSTYQVRRPGPPDGDRYFNRLREVTQPLGIEVLDQYDWLAAHKQPVATVHFAHDGHWSPNGHRVAAEMVLDHLAAHPDLCRRVRQQAR